MALRGSLHRCLAIISGRISSGRNSKLIYRHAACKNYSSLAPKLSENPVPAKGFDQTLHWDSVRSDSAEDEDGATESGSEDDGKDNLRFTSYDRVDSRFSEAKNTSAPHIPVLCREVLDCFWRLDSLGDRAPVFLDMTFGAGGHTSAILETFPDCTVYALDRDPLAGEYAAALREKYPDRLIPLTGRFSQLPALLSQVKMKTHFDGILVDAGCSSMQMDRGERGFAFSKPDSPLDMRMDGRNGDSKVTAAEVVNRMDEENLGNLFRKYGDEKQSKRIARAIVESRFMMKKLVTTGDLADIVMDVIGKDASDRLNRRQHPATKVFQALRIFVNDELNELDYALSIGHTLLRPKGIFVSITFHSMECQIVKEHFHSADWKDRLSHNPDNPQLARSFRNHARFLPKDEVLDTMQFRWSMLHKKAIQPSDEEMKFNPRCRSAKLRAALKLDV